MQHRTLYSLLPLILLLLVQTSCEKFSGDQTIPAYISIDSITLSTDYSQEGSASHNITDAWIYVDDELIGAFELPAKPPVLKSGSHKITILPGIKKNGIAATRVVYDFYKGITSTLKLSPDSVTNLGIKKTSYNTTTEFLWMEDFDGVGLSLDTTTSSKAFIEKTSIGSDSTFEGAHSGKVILDTARDFFEATNHLELSIPYSPVYIEINFNINQTLTVGLFLYGSSTLYQIPVITLNPTDGTWKKIYVELTNSLNAYSDVSTFKVYFGTYRDETVENPVILLDNLKLVTRNISD